MRDIGYGSALLVVVGAGASHDSLPPSVPFQGDGPPLTKDLAASSPTSNQLASRYPRARPLLHLLREQLTKSPPGSESETATLESVLGEYLALAASDPSVRNHIAAMRFYLRDLILDSAQHVLESFGGITNYTGLVRRCYQWAVGHGTYVCFVSFNYDHLLELACDDHFGFNLADLRQYYENPNVSLLKPHGSALWAWPHPDIAPQAGIGDPAAVSVAAGEPEALSAGTLVAFNYRPSVVSLGPGRVTPAYPALALPILGKTSLLWPREQDQLFREDIPNGSFGRVLIVGWRAAEEHFVGLIERLIPKNARLLVVTGGRNGPAEAQEVQGRLPQFGPQAQYRASVDGFGRMSDDDWEWLLS